MDDDMFWLWGVENDDSDFEISYTAQMDESVTCANVLYDSGAVYEIEVAKAIISGQFSEFLRCIQKTEGFVEDY